MLLWAAVLGVVFASCENEGTISPEPQEPELITATLECAGEFVDFSTSPLSKAETTNEIYYVEVYSLTLMEMGTDMQPYWYETPYAYGTFDSLEGVTINLLSGSKYRFKVGIVIHNMATKADYGKTFNYSTTFYNQIWISQSNEAYYGELSQFSPEESTSVVIDTKRVSYGAKFVAEDLKFGTLEIAVSDNNNMIQHYVNLTPETPEKDNIYSFRDYWSAWHTAVNRPAETYKENYTINVTWLKSENDRVPMGSYSVAFERNMRTTIRIKVEDLSTNSGISVYKESTPIMDSSTEYYIEGGKVVEVPINPA